MTYCKLKKNKGFTLIELMIIIAIVGTLAGIAFPMFNTYIDKAKVTRAKSEIKLIGSAVLNFYFEWDRFPIGLEEVGLGGMLDPYGNPYMYMPAPADKKGASAKMRKDHNLVPVNTDFDLYSMGKDGKSVAPFTAKASRDDIVRANNGQYVGLASGY